MKSYTFGNKCPECGNPVEVNPDGYAHCLVCRRHNWLQPQLPTGSQADLSESSTVGIPSGRVDTSGSVALFSGTMTYPTFAKKVALGIYQVDFRGGHNGRKCFFREDVMKLNAHYWLCGEGNCHVIYFDDRTQEIVHLVDGHICGEMWGLKQKQTYNRMVSLGLSSPVICGRHYTDIRIAA